jgi:hypothetical protein
MLLKFTLVNLLGVFVWHVKEKLDDQINISALLFSLPPNCLTHWEGKAWVWDELNGYTQKFMSDTPF